MTSVRPDRRSRIPSHRACRRLHGLTTWPIVVRPQRRLMDETIDGAVPAPRAWQVVLEHIETDLLDGRLAPGDRLPAERELAATLGVGRSSVREALRVLEVMGLIRTGTGSGPTSGAIIIATPHGGMSALLRLQVAAQRLSARRRREDPAGARVRSRRGARRRPAPVHRCCARRARRDGCRRPHARRVPGARRSAAPGTRRGVRQRRDRGDDGGPAHRDRVVRARGGTADRRLGCRRHPLASRAPRDRRRHRRGRRRSARGPSSTSTSPATTPKRASPAYRADERHHHGHPPAPQPRRAARAHEVQEARARRTQAASRRGAHDLRPAA